jgi:hypothetical protein
MSMSPYLRSASAALVAAFAFGLVAPDAHAQGTTVTVTSTFSGTFATTHMDTNGDGLRSARQSVTASGPLGISTIEGLNEFAIAGPGTCANGNPGQLFTFLTAATGAPASLVQRSADTGDLLILAQDSGSVCLDLVQNILFAEATGRITGGTGILTGATGTFTLTSQAQFLFFNLIDAFGPQTGTLTETITLPAPIPAP